MLLLYLTRFTEYDKFLDKEYSWTWKGYNFDVINQLAEKNYINQGTHPSRTKKVVFNTTGEKYARELLAKHGINN